MIFGVTSTYSSSSMYSSAASNDNSRAGLSRMLSSRSGGPDVGEFLRADGIHDQVVVARVFSDDHALVDFVAGTDHQFRTFLQFPQRVADRGAVFLRDQHAV